jgi:hypothetical protein
MKYYVFVYIDGNSEWIDFKTYQEALKNAQSILSGWKRHFIHASEFRVEIREGTKPHQARLVWSNGEEVDRPTKPGRITREIISYYVWLYSYDADGGKGDGVVITLTDLKAAVDLAEKMWDSLHQDSSIGTVRITWGSKTKRDKFTVWEDGEWLGGYLPNRKRRR